MSITFTRDREALSAAKANQTRDADVYYAELLYPMVRAIVHSTRLNGSVAVQAQDDDVLLSAPKLAGWLAGVADDHNIEDVHITAGAARYAIEQLGSPEAFEAVLRPSADAGLRIYVDTSMVSPPPAPPKPVPLVRLGTTVLGPFAIGKVYEVEQHEFHGIPRVLDQLGRDTTLLNFLSPDRLGAQRHNSPNSRLYWRTNDRTAQPAAEWLRDVVLAYEPRLLLIERAAIERSDLDPAAIAREYRLAVGVTP